MNKHIETLYKGRFVLLDLVDQTVELTVEDNVYSYSESIELLKELQSAVFDIPVQTKPSSWGEALFPSASDYQNHLPRLIKEIKNRAELKQNKETKNEEL